MKIDYTVHSVATEKVAVVAMLGDREVGALVDGLTVEMVGGEGDHGHTFRFVPHGAEDMEAHKALFVVGAAITASFSATEGAQAPAQAETPEAQHDAPQADAETHG